MAQVTGRKQWRTRSGLVKELIEELKRFLVDAKVYYDMGPNGPETIGKAQYAKTWGDSEEMGVLLGR